MSQGYYQREQDSHGAPRGAGGKAGEGGDNKGQYGQQAGVENVLGEVEYVIGGMQVPGHVLQRAGQSQNDDPHHHGLETHQKSADGIIHGQDAAADGQASRHRGAAERCPDQHLEGIGRSDDLPKAVAAGAQATPAVHV